VHERQSYHKKQTYHNCSRILAENDKTIIGISYMFTLYSSLIFSLNSLAVLASSLTLHTILHICGSRILNCKISMGQTIVHNHNKIKRTRESLKKKKKQLGNE